MIPKLIQRQGAQHLAEEDQQAPAGAAALDPPRAVLELVPESVCRENLVLPLKLDGRTLHVAAVNVSNVMLRDKLSFVLNKDIRLVAYPPYAILAAINRHYGHTRSESVDSMLMAYGGEDAAVGDHDEVPSTVDTMSGGGAVRRRMTRAASATPRLDSAPRSEVLSRSAVEFRKGPKGLEDEVDLERQLRGTVAEAGEDTTPDYGTRTMWYYTVEEGQRALMVRRDGRMEVIVGPKRVWAGSSRFERMRHFVAHPGEFLIVRFRDGRQEHLVGPTDVWFDPRVHETVTRQDALQLAAKEAVIVYSRPANAEAISRRIVHGPMLFVPAPGEWLHTFAWHGSDGGSQGAKKVAKGLVFQKLWLMPDQMYHDVTDVRTADDAVLTIKLMMFFELADIDRMLEATHDPIGDFINAATSDVVDFCGRHTFEEFKKNTGDLNELATYRQLTVRAAQNGYRINKVVYRGYGAPDRLQAMHDQAIEARTKLQLERATEEQAQGLEDYKLRAQMNRATSRRTEQTIEVQTEIELAQKRQEAEMRTKEAERNANREQRRRDAEAEMEVRRQTEERTRQHLAALKEMGVDLTAFLTQGRADRVIELRGGGKGGLAPHLHLDGADGPGAG
ncbi:hypothetical protein [Gemmata sp.]|uniref:GspE/PulE/PilB domain-containing protein n=1 Tax=Gemmata sp. TaxID=1914242 RepID=UPI003F70DF00